VQLLEETVVAPVLPAVEVTALKLVRGVQKKGAPKAVAKKGAAALEAAAGLLASKVNTRLASKRAASVVTAEKRKQPAKKVKAAQARGGCEG
jgi:hypothetical protein